MKREEIIEQLDSLEDHCKSFAEKDEPDNIWNKDVEALKEAKIIIKEAESRSNNKGRRK